LSLINAFPIQCIVNWYWKVSNSTCVWLCWTYNWKKSVTLFLKYR